jgi:hypothetical protein
LVITTNNYCTNQTYVPKKTQRLKFGFGFSLSWVFSNMLCIFQLSCKFWIR